MISICIPTYEMHGRGKALLERSLNAIKEQTYTDFEVVISDNSDDDVIKNLCENARYQSLNINYFKNPRKGMAPNTNEAIKKAKGDLVKILYMDDYLAHQNALQEIADNFKGHWLVTGCEHDDGNKRYNPHYPAYNKKIYTGKNTIGSPSVLTILNENPFFFDENLTWLLDCDYYKRMNDTYGSPTILNEINVVIGTGGHQTTHHLPSFTKLKEHFILWLRYRLR